jgi:hypothetical protein
MDGNAFASTVHPVPLFAAPRVRASAVYAAAPRAGDTLDKHADDDSEKAESSKFEPFKAEAKVSNGVVTVGGQSIVNPVTWCMQRTMRSSHCMTT